MFKIFGKKKKQQAKIPAVLPVEDFNVLSKVRTFQKDMESVQKASGAGMQKHKDAQLARDSEKAVTQTKYIPTKKPMTPEESQLKIEKEILRGLSQRKKQLTDIDSTQKNTAKTLSVPPVFATDIDLTEEEHEAQNITEKNKHSKVESPMIKHNSFAEIIFNKDSEQKNTLLKTTPNEQTSTRDLVDKSKIPEQNSRAKFQKPKGKHLDTPFVLTTESEQVKPKTKGNYLETPLAMATNTKRIESTPPKPRIVPEKPLREQVGAPTIKTFQADVGVAIKEQKQSVASIAIAEQKKHLEPKRSVLLQKESTGGIKKALVSIFIIMVVGLSGFAGWSIFSKHTSKIQPTQITDDTNITISQTIIPDSLVSVDITGLQATEIKNLIHTNLTSAGGVNELREIVLTEQNSISADVFISLWANNIPSRLLRNISSNFKFGTFFLTNNQSFFVFEVQNFEQSFAGMLKWENNIVLDMSSVTELPILNNGQFVDMLLSDKDVRVLKNTHNDVILVYLVPKDGLLIITTGIESMRALINRVFR